MVDPTGPDDEQIERMWVTISASMHRRRRRRVVVVAVAAVAVALATLAVVRTHPSWIFASGDATSLRCYSEVSSNLGDDFPGTTVQLPDDESDPRESCAAIWVTGVLGTPPFDSPQDDRGEPELVACRSGRLVLVYPGPPHTCDLLNLTTYPSGTP